MENVSVRKKDLIAILTKNRGEHRDIFLDAQKKYREKVIVELDKQLELARKGDPFVLARIINLIAPQDYTKHYDRALKMLEMETEEIVVLDKEDFTNLVQDEWDWSRQWARSNSSYTSSSKFDPFMSD